MYTSFHRIGPAAVIMAALFAVGSNVAQAAPQALALVATQGKVGLVCEGSDCSAEFTTFCLQSDRFAPAPGTGYRLADARSVQVLGTTRDGRKIALDPQVHLRFESMRGHVAVRISTTGETMRGLDLTAVEIAVGENVSLLPVPEPGDADPITESDIAILTGSLRPLGTQIVDDNEARMQAAQITNRMINLLPPRGETSGASATALWRQAVDGIGKGRLSSGAKDMARGAYSFCKFNAERNAVPSLRRCLQTEHDSFIQFLNSEYWDAVKTGS
jgi:hypothetical protein